MALDKRRLFWRAFMSTLKVYATAGAFIAGLGATPAALLASDGSAFAQNSYYGRVAPHYEAGPFTADGSVIVNGEVVGRDPDQGIRASLLREDGNRHGD